jgi:hypothetical protein
MIHSPQFRNVPGGTPASPRRPEKSENRALVPVGPAPRLRRTAPPRTSAAFLAQLIATAQQAPQTREKRRIGPDAAIAAYTSVKNRAIA